MKLHVLTACLFYAIASSAASDAAGGPGGAPAAEVPAGAYILDRSHASLVFRIDHLGLSMYTARFTRFDAELEFDPRHPASARLTATVDARSLETDFPFADQLDFNAQLLGDEWLRADDHPQMTYRSTEVVLTGTNTARIDGELTLRGVTRPMALEAAWNGGYAGHPMDPNARIGFSARGTLRRSDYGMTYGIPEPGSKMGVGDEVEVIIEAELTGPAWEGADASGGR